jgi:uncharacterized membrane protein
MSTSASPQQKTTHPIFKKTRMEAFSDGVFAVAITLLVVDIAIKIPNLSPGIPEFEQDWWPDFWPKAVIFAYSFVVVSVYWVMHHNEMNLLKGTTRELNWLNLVFLLFIVLIPFSAALLGNNWRLTEITLPGRFWYMRIPIFIYSANLILASISLQFVWLYARRRGLIDESRDAAPLRPPPRRLSVFWRTVIRNCIIPIATVLVLILSRWEANLAQWVLVSVPLSYAVWTLWAAGRIRKLREDRYQADPSLHRALS